MERIWVGGIPFTGARREALARTLCDRAERKARGWVFTPNAEIAARAERDPDFSALLRKADFCAPDGVGISLAARLEGRGRLSRLPGIELGETVVAHAARRGIPVFFYGGKEGVARRAADRIKERCPNLSVAGCLDGYGDREAAAEEILASGAPIVLVCLGTPLQEEFIAAHLEDRVALALGGSLDVWAGRVHRAPRFFRLFGLEWLWRVLSAPQRIPRLLPAFGFLFRSAGRGFAHLRQRMGRKARSVNKN